MQIRISGATYSKITAIGEKVRAMEKQSGEKFLYLNQGVNSVVPINLTEVVKLIDFNSRDIQVYPPMLGRPKLKELINHDYFNGNSDGQNMVITGGGMMGLDLVFQAIDVRKVWLPAFYWGSYFNILKIRGIDCDFYESFEQLENNIVDLQNSAVIICDPNNPIGDKYDDNQLVELISKLNSNGTISIIDSPYRKVFYNNDDFFEQIGLLENVIVNESFSKSMGLSGQRIGFVHSVNQDLISELGLRLMYSTNGINGFAQMLVEKLMDTEEGKNAVKNFRETTSNEIATNIEYLENNGFLSKEFFGNSKPKGIFTVINKPEKELLENRIAAISLEFFTRKHKAMAAQHSRICVSVPHHSLKEYFEKL